MSYDNRNFLALSAHTLNELRAQAAQPDIITLELSEHWSLERVALMERKMNEREEHQGTNRRYRILPYGLNVVDVNGTEKPMTPDKVLLQCKYCGRYGALYCACPGCGAPIGVPSFM